MNKNNITFLFDSKSKALAHLGEDYDLVTQDAINSELPLHEIAGIMANRLGELVRLYGDYNDPQALLDFCYQIMTDRAFSGTEK